MSDAREAVHKAISASAVLRPLHVEVRNESCWYYMRKRLGPRRQAWFDIQYNEAHLHYEAFIYQLVRREEDLNVVPRKVLVGSAAERWKAFKICEKAIKERDNNALAIKRDALERGLKLDLDSHISLLVVSEAFGKLDNIDRLGVVCADLLASLGSPPASSSSDLSHCPPTKVKHFSTLGRQVRSLMIFRALPSHCGATLQIRALTPAQWRPQLYPPALSERLGRDHQQLGALGVSEGAQPDNQRWRLQKLSAAPFDVNSTTVGSHDDSRPVTSTVGVDSSVVSSRTDATDRSALRRPGRELVDSIGLHESVSGVQYAKLGGIYGHFFNDLSSDVRAMVLERYQNNKELIRIVAPAAEPAPLQAFPDQPQPSFQPKTNLSMLRAKIKANHELGEADRGSANQDEMRDEVMLSNKRIHLLALRLQRIRRIHMVYRARRRLWKRFYACLVVQRAVRGWFGRRFVGLFRKLQPIAARRIQSFYRNIRTNRVLYKWQSVSYRLTRVVMRLIKLFFQKCYLRWMAKREHSAALIQSAVRVRIAVIEKYKRMGDKHLVRFAFSKAAVKIQKTIRGLFGRRRYEAFLEEQLKQRVDAPAALKIQRIFRGRLAKCVLHQRRLERKCAIQIQRLVRYFLRMLGLARMRRAALEICSATAIQSAYRGHFDRLIVALCKHQRWYETKYIPSIVKLQAWMRTAFARKKYITLKTNNRAALVIQRSYLFNKKRWLGKLQRRRMFQVKLAVKVTMIQAAVRRFLCMKTFRRRLLAYRGKVIFAAKLISRAWKSFTLQRKYQELLDDSRREAEGRAIAKCFAVRQNILRDIREMQADLSQIDRGKERAAVRLKELKEFQAQSSLRLSSVKKEMGALTVDDFERGEGFIHAIEPCSSLCM